MAKRIFDFFFAGILGVLILPLAGLIALFVWLESGLPVLHRSLRVGQHGQPFYYLRFRTKVGEPPQKTRFGRLIGNLSLDELPIFLNVLRGDLSFIGPRPEIPEKVDLDNLDWQVILSVRPGLTGPGLLAYLEDYNQTPVEERIQPDLYYAQHKSFGFDVKLLAKTLVLWLKMEHLKGKV